MSIPCHIPYLENCYNVILFKFIFLILIGQQPVIAAFRQRIEEERRRQEEQDGEEEVLREGLRELEQSNVHIRPVKLPPPSSPAASINQPQQKRLNVRLDKFDEKSSAVQC